VLNVWCVGVRCMCRWYECLTHLVWHTSCLEMLPMSELAELHCRSHAGVLARVRIVCCVGPRCMCQLFVGGRI
jgi:hypothetical protein